MSVFEDGSAFIRQILAFQKRSYDDVKLRPSSRLLYRVLCEIGNYSRWRETFAITNVELMKLTGLCSDRLADAKQALKQKGYIEYWRRKGTTIYKLENLADKVSDKKAPEDKEVSPEPLSRRKEPTTNKKAGMGERIRVREMEWARRWEEMNGLEEDMRERP